MVELIHDDVIERRRPEALQMFTAAQGLDRREDHFSSRILHLARIMAKPRLGTNSPKRVQCLVEYFLAVRYEQHSLEFRTTCIEGREPRFAETCCHDDQSRAVACGSRGLQSLQ